MKTEEIQRETGMVIQFNKYLANFKMLQKLALIGSEIKIYVNQKSYLEDLYIKSNESSTIQPSNLKICNYVYC